jgi:intracellular sulfur oxidation DsrE/DsrF family protein
LKYSNIFIAATLMAALVSFPSHAAKDNNGNKACPVGFVKDLSLDDEFGPGTQELTRCIKVRTQVKMVVQINQFCSNNTNPAAGCGTTPPYALNNISNILDDYEITHGMKPGKDYEVVAVLHGPGGRMALKDTGINGAGSQVSGRNQFQSQVEGLMARGVKFYFCQNTTRTWMSQNPATPDVNVYTSLPKWTEDGAWATDQIIDGMLYSTAGLTSIADFEALGYQYIQP